MGWIKDLAWLAKRGSQVMLILIIFGIAAWHDIIVEIREKAAVK